MAYEKVYTFNDWSVFVKKNSSINIFYSILNLNERRDELKHEQNKKPDTRVVW